MQEEGKFPWSPRKRMRGPRRADAGAMEDEKGEGREIIDEGRWKTD